MSATLRMKEGVGGDPFISTPRIAQPALALSLAVWVTAASAIRPQ